MNGYANADTYFAAMAVTNIENLYISARRFINHFQLRNMLVDAQLAGIIGDDIEIENVDCEQVLDTVLAD